MAITARCSVTIARISTRFRWGCSQMRSALPLLVLTPLLAACAGSPGSINKLNTAGAGHYKVGKPYQIRGKWYRPADDRDYDETGIASWYGPKFDGKPTANGELLDQDALTAAHKTLQLPSRSEEHTRELKYLTRK